MAGEIIPIDPSKLKPKKLSIDVSAKPIDTGFGSQINKFTGGLAASAAEGVGNLAALPSNVLGGLEYLGNKIPLLPKTKRTEKELENRESIQELPIKLRKLTAEGLGLTEEDIKPTTIAGKAIQSTVGNWPIIAIGGASGLAPRIARDLAQSLGGEIAAKTTNSKVAKILGSVLGGKGFDAASGWFNSIAKEGSSLKNITSKDITPVQAKKESLYEYVDKEAPKVNIKSKDARNILGEVSQKVRLDTGLSTAEEAEILSKIKKFDARLTTPQATGTVLQKMKKDINEAWGNAPYKSKEREYYSSMKNSINDLMDKSGNPKWNQARKAADELHSLQNWKSSFKEIASQWIPNGKYKKVVTSNLTQGALALATGFKYGTTAGVISAAIPAGVKAYEELKRPILFLNHLSATEDGKKLLWDIVANSAKKSGPALYKDIAKFNQKAKSFEQSAPDEKKGKIVPIDPNKLKSKNL